MMRIFPLPVRGDVPDGRCEAADDVNGARPADRMVIGQWLTGLNFEDGYWGEKYPAIRQRLSPTLGRDYAVYWLLLHHESY
jgi:hypothetical protein